MSPPDQPEVLRFRSGVRGSRLARCVGLAIVWLLLAAPLGRAQSEPVVIRSEGGNTGFPDDDDPDRLVLVFFGGVDIAWGDRRMRGDTLVAILQRGGNENSSSKLGAGESILPGANVLELFVDGDVTLQEKDEQVLGAQSIYVDNVNDTLTILEGTWRSTVIDTPLVVRYEIMHRLADGVMEMEGVSYTTCDFAHAHWAINTPWTRLVPTEAGRILHTSWNSAEAGGVPFLWMPAIHLNVDRDKPPLRSVGFNTSNKFGTAITTTWGGDASKLGTTIGGVLGVEGPVDAGWEMKLNNYTKRGVFYEPKWSYKTTDSKGVLLGSFINDHAKRDDLEEPIYDNTRGRIELEHRTRLDENRTIDVELSYVSDYNYLREYYEHEDRVDKPPETYISYRDVVDNKALTVLGRVRLNNYQTQVEYLPRVERRLTGEPIDTGWFGTAYFSSVTFADNVALRAEKALPDDFGEPDPTQPSSKRNIRAGTRGLLQWPIDIGGDRITVTGGYDVTGFDKTAKRQDDLTTEVDESKTDSSGAVRYALLGGVEWLRTYSGTSDYQSDLWNMDGVRQILEPRIAYQSVFELNEDPDDLLQIDRNEALAKKHAFTVGVRHRIQTHQHGKVVTTLSTDISMTFFPNEDRDNPIPVDGGKSGETKGQTKGPFKIDMQWKPGADIPGLKRATVRWRALYDPEEWRNLESFASYTTDFGDDQRFLVAHNKVRKISNFLTSGVQWILTPRWTIAAFNQHDILEDQNARRGVILRNRAHRWLIDVELSRRRGRSRVDSTSSGRKNRNDTRFSISFRPTFAAGEETLLDEIGKIR
jgi:lipopolysaccharide assembly outer membrane protein LptD (OstA)